VADGGTNSIYGEEIISEASKVKWSLKGKINA
jgi:hypothetical protein